MPVGSAADAGGVSQFRIRTGLGYRRCFAWRVEALCISSGTRSADGHGFDVKNALDIRVERVL
jgi:hypothetical protein